jgi:hypothetical protein
MEDSMTQDEAFSRLSAAVYAAVLNSALVDEAVEGFAGTGIRVHSLALTMHVTTVPEGGHLPGCPLAGTVTVQPAAADADFLKQLRIAPDLTPDERSSE